MTFENKDLHEILDTVSFDELFFVRVVINGEIASSHNWKDNNEFHNAWFKYQAASDKDPGYIMVANFNDDLELISFGSWPLDVVDNWLVKPIRSKEELQAEKLERRLY